MQDSLSVSAAGSKAKQLFSRTVSLPFASCADTLTVMRSGPEPKTCSAPSSPSDHFSVPVRESSPLLRSRQPIRTDSLRSNIYKREQAERMSQVEFTKNVSIVVSRCGGWYILARRFTERMSQVEFSKNVCEQPTVLSRCDGWYILARRFKDVHPLWYRIARRTLVLHHAPPVYLLADASAQGVAPFSPAVPAWPSSLGRQPRLRTSSVVVPFVPRVRLSQMTPLPRRVAA